MEGLLLRRRLVDRSQGKSAPNVPEGTKLMQPQICNLFWGDNHKTRTDIIRLHEFLHYQIGHGWIIRQM